MGCLLGEEVSDESSGDDLDDAPEDSEMEEDDPEDSNPFKAVLDRVDDDNEEGEDAWEDEEESEEVSKKDLKGKGKAQPASASAHPSAKSRKGAEITKRLSRRYRREAAVAHAKGGDHYQKWASHIVKKGLDAITTLRQRTMNDKTRLKALRKFELILEAFVSFLGLQPTDMNVEPSH